MRVVCADCETVASPTATFACEACGGALVVAYDAPLDPAHVEAGGTLFRRFGERLPSRGSAAGIEGGTPLLPGDRLADALGVEATVWLKDERRNPTGSFKDRALAPTVSLAAEAGYDAVLTASTGNAGAACAHYAARAGLECYLLAAGDAPPAKLVEPLAYGATAVRVDGLFDGGEAGLRSILSPLAERLDAYMAFAYRPFNPVPAEGVKTIAYEVAEALDWAAPDVVVTATGGGDNLWAQGRGYAELREAGLVEGVPRMVAAQADGAAPVTAAVERGADAPVPLEATDTVVSGIDAPFAGAHALAAIRESGGTAVASPDEDIIAGELAMARTTGVWPEPASAAVVPALARLWERGWLSPDDRVVLTITGSGHKQTGPIADRLPALPTVARDVEAVAAALAGAGRES